MRKAIIFFTLLVALQVMAQDKTNVTIKSSAIDNGVLVIPVHATAAVPGHTSQVLQCTKGMPDCSAPKAGEYVMVRLPKNYGMYDCVNVDLYALGADPETSDKVGEYCLLEK